MRKATKVIVKLITTMILLNLVFGISACENSYNDNINDIPKHLIGIEQIEMHDQRMLDVETPYTLCYKNCDGSVSMYIFPSPIAFRDENNNLHLIDVSLTEVSESEYIKLGYTLQTRSGIIKTYFPKSLNDNPIVIKDGKTTISFFDDYDHSGSICKKDEYTDVFGGRHQSVTYYNNDKISFQYVPTSTGVIANVIFYEEPDNKNLTFYFNRQPEQKFLLDNDIVFLNGEESSHVGVIYSSFLQDSSGKLSFYNRVNIEETEDKIKYTIALDELFLSNDSTKYPVVISPSFEINTNNLMNVSVYSKRPKSYLSNYSIVGIDDYHGKGSLCLKFRINYLVKTYMQNIKSATYNFYNIGGNSSETIVQVQRLKGFWNNTSIELDELSENYTLENYVCLYDAGLYTIDITKYVKSCVYDDTYNTENYGLMLSSNSEGAKVIANYYNSFYKPYVRIDFYDMPWTFEDVDVIQP